MKMAHWEHPQPPFALAALPPRPHHGQLDLISLLPQQLLKHMKMEKLIGFTPRFSLQFQFEWTPKA
jgi:hypothetical protein